MKKIELKRKNSFVRFGVESFAKFNANKFVTSVITATEEFKASQGFLEIALPLHAGSYALIGYKFEPKESNELTIDVGVCEEKQIFQDTIALDKTDTYVGLTDEYANIITESILGFFKLNRAPKGKISICMGAYSEICSSPIIFSIITNSLMDVFNTNDLLNEEHVIRVCEDHLQKRFN